MLGWHWVLCRFFRCRFGDSRRLSVADNKTTSTNESVDAYITSRANDKQIADCRTLMELFKKITKQVPKMWGPSIVGYGSYHYTYESGRTGEAPLAGFAIRGRELCIYLDCEESTRELLDDLGKHRMSKSCLYLKQLSDIKAPVLEQLIVNSIATVKRRYG